jgi:hypothetical protein
MRVSSRANKEQDTRVKLEEEQAEQQKKQEHQEEHK